MLQPFNLNGDGWLGKKKALGRPRKTTLLGNNRENMKLF